MMKIEIFPFDKNNYFLTQVFVCLKNNFPKNFIFSKFVYSRKN